jgi:hypothetical protein
MFSCTLQRQREAFLRDVVEYRLRFPLVAHTLPKCFPFSFICDPMKKEILEIKIWSSLGSSHSSRHVYSRLMFVGERNSRQCGESYNLLLKSDSKLQRCVRSELFGTVLVDEFSKFVCNFCHLAAAWSPWPFAVLN